VPVLQFPWLRRPDDDAYAIDVAEEHGLGRLLTEGESD
jgi:hypothetical protein